MLSRLKTIPIIVTCVAVAACEFGYVSVPSIQILAEPATPVDKSKLVQRLTALASSEGYSPNNPELLVPDQYSGIESSDVGGIVWRSDDESDENYELWMLWEPRDSNQAEWVRFTISRNGETEPFELEDWQYFARWYSQVIPGLFDDAEVNVVIHPARYTEPEKVGSFRRQSGFPELSGSKYENPDDALWPAIQRRRLQNAEAPLPKD